MARQGTHCFKEQTLRKIIGRRYTSHPLADKHFNLP